MLDKEQYLLAKLSEEATEVVTELTFLVGKDVEEIAASEYDLFYEIMDFTAVASILSSNLGLDSTQFFALNSARPPKGCEDIKDVDTLLISMIRSCSRVSKLCNKTQLYGIGEVYEDKTNHERIYNQCADVLYHIHYLINLGVLKIITTSDEKFLVDRLKAKIKKLNNYLSLSQELHRVEDTFFVKGLEEWNL